MKSTTIRRSAAVLLAGGAAAATLAIPSSASAETVGGYFQVGPGLGDKCVSAYANLSVRGSGFVVSGTGANFQLRYSGSQVAGSGSQVAGYAVEARPGLPAWRGAGYYQFCARNNGSPATVSLTIITT